MSWVELVDDYDPTAAFNMIQRGAIDTYLTHQKKRPIRFTDERKMNYLRHLASTGSHNEASFVAGVDPSTVNKHAREDPDAFGAAKTRAHDFFCEVFIDRTARKVAIEGWEKPVFYKGEQVGSEWQFCPRTFELYAKRMNPAYREKVQADVNVTGGILVIPAVAASVEEWLQEGKAVEAQHRVEEADAE